MLTGAVLVLAALSLFLYNQWEARQAAASADRILPQVIGKIEENIEKGQKSEAAGEADGHEDAEWMEPEYRDLFDPAMTEVEIEGYGYVGYLSIPTLQLELPVMSECDRSRLKISPCRFAGSTKTDNLVIAGHNYTRFFGTLSRLSPGDMVYLIDMDGMLSSYEVAEVEVLAPTDIEGMISGNYALTLFTCTYDIKNRIAVRCERIENQ